MTERRQTPRRPAGQAEPRPAQADKRAADRGQTTSGRPFPMQLGPSGDPELDRRTAGMKPTKLPTTAAPTAEPRR